VIEDLIADLRSAGGAAPWPQSGSTMAA
jgi:hypothetical protein